MLPILLASAVMVLSVWLIRDSVADWPPLGQLAVLVPLGALAYLATLALIARRYLSESWGMIIHRDLEAA